MAIAKRQFLPLIGKTYSYLKNTASSIAFTHL